MFYVCNIACWRTFEFRFVCHTLILLGNLISLLFSEDLVPG